MANKYNIRKLTPCARRKSLRSRGNNFLKKKSENKLADISKKGNKLSQTRCQNKMEDTDVDMMEANDTLNQISFDTPQSMESGINSPIAGTSNRFGGLKTYGRRIVNVAHFFNEIIAFPHLKMFGCVNENLSIIKEQRVGFLSFFTIKCNSCLVEKQISTEPSMNYDINKSIILGTISNGGGYHQMEEWFSICDIPCMSSHFFQKQQNVLANSISEISWQSIEKAGQMEKEIAIRKGHILKDGIPYVTVIADGAWSKRSYKVNYDASSGVVSMPHISKSNVSLYYNFKGVIIGKETRKVLYVGVKNKYCCICARAATKEVEIPPHICFKNWSQSSTSMESAIILEGFRLSIEMHGLRYLFLVGDGDSSVTKKLAIMRPYGDNLVRKIECTNHLMRNYCNKLRELTKKNISSQRKVVPITLRNILKNNIKRLRYGPLAAVKHLNELCTEMEHSEKINLLREDISNAVFHVFGDHRNCRKYFCQKQNENELSIIQAMQDVGLFYDIQSCTERLVINAESLILNMNNNAAELYNSIVAKFVGGKRINFSSRNSYKTRCEASVIHYNEPYNLPVLINKSLNKKSPGHFTKKYLSRRSNAQIFRQCRKKLFSKNHKNKSILEPDEDYGLVTDNMTADEYKKEEEEYLKNINLNNEQIIDLQYKTIGQNNTFAWNEERRKRLTASNFGKICKQKSGTHCQNLVKALIYSSFSGTKATEWGKNHENVAISDFKKKCGTDIKPCGLFVDPRCPYLAASPDGLIENDGLLEIKCPYSARMYTPKEAILKKIIKYAVVTDDNKIVLKKSHDYYYQIQGQLHITQKKFCIFIIWTPLGYSEEKIYRDDVFWRKKMSSQLEIFFHKCFLPEKINPQFPRGLPVKDFRQQQTEK